MHDGDETPKAASERITAPAHARSGILLADGAADGIWAVGTRPAAAGDFMPANRVASGERRNGYKQQQKQQVECFYKWKVFKHPPYAAETLPANPLASPGSLI